MDNSPNAYLENLLSLQEAVMNDGGDLPLSVITRLEEETCRLQLTLMRARNLHSPSNKLPHEVLELIFEFGRPKYDSFLPCWPSDRTLRDCLAITHVCADWRRVALGLPFLWANIDLCHGRSTRAATAFLERSRHFPLTIFYSMPSDDYGDRCAMLEEILCDEAARLEQLHMATETVHDLIFVGHLLGYAAPKVYSLSLGTCTASDMRRLTYANTLFDGQCRSIRKLTVVDFPIWESNISSNLSHLAVYSTRNGSGKLQDILERSPNLEELIITDVDMSDDRRSMISISLPRLQNLQLNMQVLADNDISSFVSRMDIPSSCRYQVAHARLQDVMSVASAPLFRPIQDNIHTAQLLVRCGPVRMAIFHGVLSVQCSWRDVAGLSGKLDPSFELVVIFSDGAVIKRNWMDLFSPMLHVRSLVITDHHEGRCCANTSRVAPLIDVLSSPFSHTVGPARHNTPVLPALESVRIYGASVDVWLPLWSAVSQRARAGAPLQELSIYEEPVDYRTSGTVRRISLDTAGLASRVATEESIVGAADIVAKIEYL